ncbi:hypothetical protein GCM10009818_35530 [Nakamurella flavida]
MVLNAVVSFAPAGAVPAPWAPSVNRVACGAISVSGIVRASSLSSLLGSCGGPRRAVPAATRIGRGGVGVNR